MRSYRARQPHPEILRLRAGGWTIQRIALAIHASPRQVFRWAAGHSSPLMVFEQALRALEESPPDEAAA